MSLFYRVRRLLSNLFHKDHAERELDEEMKAHLEMLIDKKVANGLSAGEAYRAARIEFGGVDQVKEQVRDVRLGVSIEQVWMDMRYALRMLRKNPSFTAIVVTTL